MPLTEGCSQVRQILGFLESLPFGIATWVSSYEESQLIVLELMPHH